MTDSDQTRRGQTKDKEKPRQVGVAVGIGIASTYDERSTTGLLFRGICNALSAGVLVYLALVDLAAEEVRGREVLGSGLERSAAAAVGSIF